ncbi:MAG: ribosome maturation factor RimP [Acidobacteriota bacterium]
MSPAAIDSTLRSEIEAVAESVGCELLHLEFDQRTLRVFLDRAEDEGGVTIDHCSDVSRELSALLDAHDFGRNRYVLEVSSPGLDRELYGPRDYRRFVGHLTRVTRVDGDGRKETIVGRLIAFDDDADGARVTIQPDDPTSAQRAGDSDAAQQLIVPLDTIQKARLEVEL